MAPLVVLLAPVNLTLKVAYLLPPHPSRFRARTPCDGMSCASDPSSSPLPVILPHSCRCIVSSCLSLPPSQLPSDGMQCTSDPSIWVGFYQICDGRADCSDGSDESKALCTSWNWNERLLGGTRQLSSRKARLGSGACCLCMSFRITTVPCALLGIQSQRPR